MMNNNTVNILISNLEAHLWGPVMLILLLGTGLFLTVRLRFIPIIKLLYAIGLIFRPVELFSDPKKKAHHGISDFAALMTSLSATIGTGSIVGVSTALELGGPGVLLWMWLTALVGLATKYAEGILAVKYRIVGKHGELRGGPMYYLHHGLQQKWLAVLFAFFAAFAAFGTGSSVQANTIAIMLEQSWHIDVRLTGFLLTILTAAVICGGLRSISKVTVVLMPVMMIFYVGSALIILAVHHSMLINTLTLIFHDAFSGQAIAGGVVGRVIQHGISRGLFSNEAGMGSAPIVAAAAKTDHPARQGFIAMTGVFFSTMLMCTLTGLVLVVGMQLYHFPIHMSGAILVNAIFEQLLPGFGFWMVAVTIIVAAYTTIIGWYYYGEKSAQYLFGYRILKPYRAVYTMSVMVGAVLSLELVWSLSNIFNALMAIPNLIALVLLSGVVVKETNDFFIQREKGLLP